MNMKIENIPAYKTGYLRQIGPYGSENVQTMEKLKSWAKTNALLSDESIILGVAHDDPTKAKPESCRYDTCLVVSEDYCVNDGFVSQGHIAGGSYAVFTISHTAEAAEKAWQEIFPTLFQQGYSLDEERPIIERYKAEMVNKHFCEICVPIK